jgi:hypothetical protein
MLVTVSRPWGALTTDTTALRPLHLCAFALDVFVCVVLFFDKLLRPDLKTRRILRRIFSIPGYAINKLAAAHRIFWH